MDSSDNKPKRGIHIHLGGIILIITLVFIFFKVNIKNIVNSPEFQSNITYIEEKGKEVWLQYLSKPFLYIWNNLALDVLSKGFNQIQENNYKLNIPTIDDPNVNEFFKVDEIRENLGGTQESEVRQTID